MSSSGIVPFIPTVVFFVAFIVFSISMFTLGVEDAAILQDSRHNKDARSAAVSFTLISAGVMLSAWISKYGLKTGLFGFDELKTALMSQPKI